MTGLIIGVILAYLILAYLSHIAFMGGRPIPYFLCIFCLIDRYRIKRFKDGQKQ